MAWYSTIFNKNAERKQFKGNKNYVPPNIYDGDKKKTYDEHTKKFHFVHFVFKYKFAVPFIRLFSKIFRKTLNNKIPNEHHNRNIIIFDKAYEEAIKKWCIYYLRNGGPPETRKTRRQALKMVKGNGSVDALRDLKNMINTMYLYDTAYREFMNILMHEIAHEMTDYYSKHPEKFFEANKTGHLFFTTDIYDTHYYVLEKAITYNTHLSVQEAEQLLNNKK